MKQTQHRRHLESELLDLANERTLLEQNLIKMRREAEELRKHISEDERVEAEFRELLRDLVRRQIIGAREFVGVKSTLKDIKITIGKTQEELRQKIHDIASGKKQFEALGTKIETTRAELAQKDKVIPWTNTRKK